MRRLLASLCIPAVALATACSADPGLEPPNRGDALEIVEAGREDNYLSAVSLEYAVTGRVRVSVDPEQASDPAVRDRAIASRLSAVGVYLTAYLTDKFESVDINGNGEIEANEIFFHNVGYGNFHAMARNRTLAVEQVSGESGTFDAQFRVDVAGPRDLLDRLPAKGMTDDGLIFDLKLPADASTSPEQPNTRPIRRFNPADYPDDQLETLELTIRALPEVQDAYPQYAAFIEDGVLDITIVLGHEYNSTRYDLLTGKSLDRTLRNLGFKAPTATFEELVKDSGAYTKQVVRRTGTPDGAPRWARIDVRMYHSDMFVEARTEQYALTMQEIAARDVFIYAGHAGPYYGLYLDGDYEAAISEAELSAVPFERDRQQLFVARGCQTYSQYADVLYAHEFKDESNLDVITTVNFSYDAGLPEFLSALVGVDTHNYLKGPSYNELLDVLNRQAIAVRHEVLYGVIGAEGNPRLHPFANPEAIGQTCARDWDCGDQNGNLCIRYADNSRRCASIALGADACPDGLRFHTLQSGGTIRTAVCMR